MKVTRNIVAHLLLLVIDSIIDIHKIYIRYYNFVVITRPSVHAVWESKQPYVISILLKCKLS